MKQLSYAWLGYSHDYNDALPPNGDATMANQNISRNQHTTINSWVNGNAYTDATNSNIREGLLFSYTSNTDIYRCPGDRSTVLDQGKIPRTRSYSLSCNMNWKPSESNPDYIKWIHRKYTQINKPPPVKALTFVDTHENSIAASSFFINGGNNWCIPGYSPWTWVHFPAVRHGAAGNVSFADGHVETKRWREENTLKLGTKKVPWLLPAASQTDRDLSWFFQSVPQEPVY